MNDVGKLRDRIEVLTLGETADGYEWQPDRRTWADVTYPSRKNLFSSVGIGVRSATLLMRRQPLTLHQAVRIGGRHGFLTEITASEDGLYQTVQAALITPVICSVRREVVEVDPVYRRPKRQKDKTARFPACLTEKYIRYEEVIPQMQNTVTYVLVTPKAIELATGEVVAVGGEQYCVQTPHLLDEHKNEYEIVRQRDA